MSLLVFAIVVILVAFLLIYAVRYIPGLPAPFSWIIPLAIVLIAAVVIANRAGLF